MASAATALGMLAMVAQLGVPVQDGGTADARPGAPLGEVVAPEPGVAGVAGFAGAPAGLLVDAVVAESRGTLGDSPFADGLEVVHYLWIEETLAGLTLREKVAQLVVAYIEGGRPGDGSPRWERGKRLVLEEKVGGFIVGKGSGYGTASWLNELQTSSDVPLLVTADLEWGPGTRLLGATVLPINMALAAAGSPEIAYQAGRITALEARAAGIHMAFAPVADVNINPENPVINTRAYGSDPAEVATRVVEFIRGAQSAGLMTVVKHFPGHGDTETDSHLQLPVLQVDRIRLDAVELAPFRAAIAAGVAGVMTAHLAVPVLDPRPKPRPATLSPPILTELLREDLGFGGLVVTDALHMDGVKRRGENGQVAVEALTAGADILLIPPSEEDAIDAVVEAVEDGVLSEARIDASVRRVLAAKALAGLIEDRHVSLSSVEAKIGRSEHLAWGREAAERSITLVRGRPNALPVRLDDQAVLAVLYDDRRSHRAGETFVAALEERGARVSAVRLSKGSSAREIEQARRMAGMADVVVFGSFSRALPWKGELGLPGEVARLAQELAVDGALVVSFGDPYLLRQLRDVPTYMLAWSEADVSQVAVARALAGEIPIHGRLPIDLPPDYGVGEGVLVPSLPGITTVAH